MGVSTLSAVRPHFARLSYILFSSVPVHVSFVCAEYAIDKFFSAPFALAMNGGGF